MKRTIIAVISMVLILFAFSACRPTVVGIPVDPTPGTPVTPSDPSIPENTIQVGGESYHNLDEAIAAAPENGTINIGKGRFIIPSTLTLSKNLTINGAGMNDTIIEVYGDYGFDVDGNSTTISNLTIADTSDTVVRLINVHSSQLKIDSVKLEGKYVSGSAGKSGIVADSDVIDITISNSVFKGIRVPLNFDLEHAESPKVTISGNTFDTFQKLSFTTSVELLNISSDNEFVNPTNTEFQIELFNKGDLTADSAIEVAEATGIVVKAELEEKVYYYFDAEGFIINDIDDLKSFADGKAGTKAKLAAPITVTAPITFSVNNLVLVGNEESVISATMGSGKHQSEVFVLNGTGITLDSIHFEAGDTNTNRIDFVIANGANATVEKCVFTGSDAAKEGTLVIYGVTSYADNTEVIGNTFEKLRVPFYFYENRSSNGKAIGNIVTDCFKIDLESDDLVDNIYDNTISNTPVTILTTVNGVMPADKVATLAKNNKTDVTHNGVTYNEEGKAVISTAEDLANVFAASTTTDELLEAVITESFTVDTPVSLSGSGLTITAAEGIEPIILKEVITIDNASGITFSGINFNVENITTSAIQINNTNTADITFYDCDFERNEKGAGALSLGSEAKNITIEECTFDNFITAIYMNGTSGRIVGNTITTYGGIYLAGVTAPYEYSDLIVEGNIADYGEDYKYDSNADNGSAWDNTLRIAVADSTALSAAIGFANTLYGDNEDMNVAVITETPTAVLWANGETVTQ